jgi:hypothetical protein
MHATSVTYSMSVRNYCLMPNEHKFQWDDHDVCFVLDQQGLISVVETWFLLRTRCSRCIWDVELYARICRKWRILHHLPRELLGVFSGMSALYSTSTLYSICIVLAHWNNSTQVDISLHSETISGLKWRILHHLPRELLGVFSGPPNLDYKKQLAIQCAHLASWAGYSLFLLSWGWHLCIKE